MLGRNSRVGRQSHVGQTFGIVYIFHAIDNRSALKGYTPFIGLDGRMGIDAAYRHGQ